MKTKCDHIIGEWQGAEEGGVVRVSSWDTDTDLEERYKFCPLCGKNTSKLKPMKAKEAKEVQLGPVEQMFVDECSKIGAGMMAKILKRPPLLNLLNEMKGGKDVPTVVFERSISTEPK